MFKWDNNICDLQLLTEWGQDWLWTLKVPTIRPPTLDIHIYHPSSSNFNLYTIFSQREVSLGSNNFKGITWGCILAHILVCHRIQAYYGSLFKFSYGSLFKSRTFDSYHVQGEFSYIKTRALFIGWIMLWPMLDWYCLFSSYSSNGPASPRQLWPIKLKWQ